MMLERWKTRWGLVVAAGLLGLAGSVPAAVVAADLRDIRTKHYLIHTDLEPALADDLAKRMDAMFDEYARRMAEFNPVSTKDKLPVYLFQKQDDYMEATQGKVPNTAGIFMAGKRNELLAYLGDQDRDALRRTLQHEAFHQFAYTTISRNLPIWLNEGMAQLFEEGIWVDDQFRIGEVPPYRIRQLRDDIKSGRMVDFEKFFRMTNRDWQQTVIKDAESGATQYNQAWAIAQFLARGSNENRESLLAWLRYMHEGSDANAAYDKAFKVTPRDLQVQFSDWGKSLAASELAMMIEHQKVLADMIISRKGRGQTFKDMFEFRRQATLAGYRIQYTRGRVKWTTHADPGIYFCDLNGKALSPDRLHFEPNPTAPLPDMICVCSDGVVLRTRFYMNGKKIQSEVMCSRSK